MSAKYVLIYNEGHSTGLSLLSFFPLAFLVTPQNKGIYPAHAQKFDLTMNKLTLNLSTHNVNHTDFPVIELQGNCMYFLTDYQAIISYPVRNVSRSN